MSIFAGKPPEESKTQIDPPFKFQEQQHTGQAMPPEATHPMSETQLLDMLNQED
jgi:hypothetical protein